VTDLTTYTDPMPALKAWAEAEAAIAGINDDRVFFTTPKGFDQSPPQTWLVLTLITVDPDTGDGPYELPVVQFDCWGRTGADAGRLRAAVCSAVTNLHQPVRGAGSVIYAGELQSGGGWNPEPEGSRAKYTLTARFLTRAA
jgi:hypothetical protein